MINPQVSKIELPQSSMLHTRRQPADFLDCYSVATDMKVRDAAKIITDFPGWAQFLLVIRRNCAQHHSA